MSEARGEGGRGGFELRLTHGAAQVCLTAAPVQPGAEVSELVLGLPDVTPPLDASRGAAQFRDRLCDLERLELVVSEGGLAHLLTALPLADVGLATLALAPRAGFVEGAGTLADGTSFTLKSALLPAGERGVEAVIYEPRIYAAAPLSAAELPALIARAASPQGRAGGPALALDPLPALLRRLLPARGWKIPRCGDVRLSAVEATPGRLRLAWDRAAAAPASPSDPDLLAAIEGARAFADAERLLGEGHPAAARDAYLALGAAVESHPFGAARLLALMVADPASRGRAEELARAAMERRGPFPAALLALAHVFAARGEHGRASAMLADLAEAAARRGEISSALAAAEACFALGPGAERAAQARAVDVALSLRRDHLPAMRALLGLGERGGDGAALLRACRRLAAYAPSPAERGEAHARLGALLLASDPPAARLHLDHALRLAPDEPGVLTALAHACEQGGETLRAVRALDRAREIFLSRGDGPGAAAAALEVAALWERAGHPENALLRCREACELAPSAVAAERAGRLAAALGEPVEAARHLAAALALADPAAPGATARCSALRRELAALAEDRLQDPSGAAEHLAAALALEPIDLDGWRGMARLAGALGRREQRAAALDRVAALAGDPAERADAALEAARLGSDDPAAALTRWRAAAEAAPRGRDALEGLAAAAAACGDAAAERDALAGLASLAPPGAARAQVLERLAALREQAGDLRGALEAIHAAGVEAPAPEHAAAELRLARATGDALRAAALLALAADAEPDPARAAVALLERAELLDAAGDAPGALAAARDAAARVPRDAAAVERWAALASCCDREEAARALLSRAALARDLGEEDAALRFAEAGTAGVAAGLGEEGEAALAEALRLGLDREGARDALAVLAARAAARGDAAAERQALEALAPLLLTGARPAAWLRIAGLAAAAGDLGAARDAAERARAVAPRDAAAVEACRATAEAQGDLTAVAERLADLAVAEPAAAGERLLARARLLAGPLARPEEADTAYAHALERLAPDPSLAAEHARLRASASALAASPRAEPLERFARRAGDPLASARALRQAADLALEQGDLSAALRCARAAHESAGDAALAGPLLGRLLYLAGSAAEARAHLASLLEAGFPGADEDEAAFLAGALAELAGEAGDLRLAHAALTRLLAVRPHDTEAALRRFALDTDRGRAVAELAEAAGATRRASLRAEALATAASAARCELEDGPLAEALFQRARLAAAGLPAALARVAEARARALRDAPGAGAAAEAVAALRDLAAARGAAGDAEGSEAALSDAAAAEARHGLVEDALRDLADLEARAAARGDGSAAAARAREAARLLAATGRAEEAAARLWPLVRADATDGDSADVLEQLLAGARRDRAELLLLRAARSEGPARAARLRAAARDLAAEGEAERARALSREAFEACPADEAAFVDALCEAAGDVERLDSVLVARAEAVPEEAAACHRARADALLAFGMRSDAVRAYEACLAVAPDDVGALSVVAEARAEREGERAAAEYDERLAALAREPGAVAPSAEARARYRLGLTAAADGRDAGAVHHLARALELAEDDARAPAALAALARAHVGLGEDERAIAAARLLADRRDVPDEERDAALELAADAAARLGDRAPGAADALEALAARRLARAPGEESDALVRRAVDALLRSGENARAEALVARAARAAEGPRRAAWLVRLADAATARGDRAAARAARGDALAADPTLAALREAHLADLAGAGDNAGLARALDAALGAPGADRAALALRLARALAAEGEVAGAERAYRIVVEEGAAAPGWEEASDAVAQALAARGDTGALARLLLARAGSRALPAARVEGFLEAAALLERSGDLGGALEATEHAREADPDAPGPWEVTARLALAAGEPERAARALLAASIRCDGRRAADAALEAAHLLDAAGCSGEAARALAAAAAADPGHPPVHRALADRATEAGDLAGAARHLHRIDRAALPQEERAEHARALARALEAARDERAARAWEDVFHADPRDAEAFERLASVARARGDAERWLALAARHEGALAGSDDVTRRRDLRCERAQLHADRGELGPAEGAWRAALALDPRHRPALRALRALLERRGDWASVADALAAEAAACDAPLEEAAFLIEEARARAARMGDRARAAMALATARSRARGQPGAESVLAEIAEMEEEIEGGLQIEIEAPEGGEPSPPQISAATSNSNSKETADRSAALTPALSRDAGEGEDGSVPQSPTSTPTPSPSSTPPPSPPSDSTPEGAPKHTTLSLVGLSESAPRPEATSPGDGVALDLAAVSSFPAGPDGEAQLRALADAAEGGARAALLAELAARLEARGELGAAADALLSALEADPHDAARAERALALASGDPGRTAAAHRARVHAAVTPTSRAAALCDLGVALAADEASLPEASEALERALALDPANGIAAGALAEAHLALGRPDRALAVLAPFEDGAPGLPLAQVAALLARAAQGAVDPSMSTPLSPALPPPGGGRETSERPTTTSGAPARQPSHPRDPAATLAAALERARAALLTDPGALEEVARAARAQPPGAREARRLEALARAAEGLAAFARGAPPRSGAAAVHLTSLARQSASPPGARGPTAQLLELLAPWLEALFPVDLARRGIGGRHRLGPQRAPELLALLESAQRALGTRPFAAFLADADRCEIALENTQPPALIVGQGVTRLPPGARRFLAARALAHADLGGVLASKFAPRDLGILLELACRFAGGEPPPLGLPQERAPAFLEALERIVPSTVRRRAAALAVDAAGELARVAPRDLAAALRRAASRVALLHTGEAGEAAAGLLAGEQRLEGLTRPDALAHPDLRDLAAFALSDAYAELRAAAEESAAPRANG